MVWFGVTMTLALLILVAEGLVTKAGLGLVRVHASHNLPVRRTSGCALQSTGDRRGLRISKGRVQKKKKKIVNFFRKGGGGRPQSSQFGDFEFWKISSFKMGIWYEKIV